VLASFLCLDGCVRSIFGIGPGLGSMSPHCSKASLLVKLYPWYFTIFGFLLFIL
jgi:hypothetical protein